MPRILDDWLSSYLEYASYTEAPRIMHFYAGVSAIAGALRRKVWIDQFYFSWRPSFYIIFVAPPGIVSKSTTADVAMNLLREVPGINFGPDSATWQALVTAFAECGESFPYQDALHPMSAITIVSSELGNLLDLKDDKAINLFIDLWDGKKSFDKRTKGSGVDIVEAPWINILGCTTPHWIAANMPSSTVGGGLTSRCIFVYADKKERYIAYPRQMVPTDNHDRRAALVHDLEHIATNLVGEYVITPEAIEWGTEWYERVWDTRPEHLHDDRLDGYIARKQTHLHKLAIILAASRRDTLIIEKEDLIKADKFLSLTEHDLTKVFSRIGMSNDSMESDRLLALIRRRGKIPYEEAYNYVRSHFPGFREFENVLSGLIRSGNVTLVQAENGFILRAGR